MVKREIESTEMGIDGLVYELSPFGDDILWVVRGRGQNSIRKLR